MGHLLGVAPVVSRNQGQSGNLLRKISMRMGEGLRVLNRSERPCAIGMQRPARPFLMSRIWSPGHRTVQAAGMSVNAEAWKS